MQKDDVAEYAGGMPVGIPPDGPTLMAAAKMTGKLVAERYFERDPKVYSTRFTVTLLREELANLVALGAELALKSTLPPGWKP
jgi:hypothetical protein